jgi:hypothetical protein
MSKKKISRSNQEVQSKRIKNIKHCTDNMTEQECEMSILKYAISKAEQIQGYKKINSDEVKKMLLIVEDFIINKGLICYGGTAINNILPTTMQFYNKSIELPDYDFFSTNALDDAKELANIFYKEGYVEVKASSAMHAGTYKVFVNFIPIADITFLQKEIFNAIKKEAIIIAGINYTPPNFLRMSMYLELSRPMGDISRWEKVLTRLNALNTQYPLEIKNECETQLKYNNNLKINVPILKNSQAMDELFTVIKNSFIDQKVVFFGGFPETLYSKYMDGSKRSNIKKIPYFDVLYDEPERSSNILTKLLKELKYKNVAETFHPPIGEFLSEHYEIKIDNFIVARIYKPIACHNYNTVSINNKEVNIATIDTILSFYLAFIYTDKPHYFKDRIICMAKLLFELEHKKRLVQTGILKRFAIKCIGVQPTIESIKAEKNDKFQELFKKRGTREYEMWFLNYNPTPKNIAEHNKRSIKNRTIERKDSLNNIDYNTIIKSPYSVPLQKNKKNKIKKNKTKKINKTRKLRKYALNKSSFLF